MKEEVKEEEVNDELLEDETIEEPIIIEEPMIIEANEEPSQDEKDDGEIQISKHGNYYTIRGTNVVIDVKTCNAIGYLENDVFKNECNDYVKLICNQYDIMFQ